MYVTRQPQKPAVRIVSLAVSMVLLVALGFGVAVGINKGFFDTARHPVFRYETPTWVPSLGVFFIPGTFILNGDRAGNVALALTLSEFKSTIDPWTYEVVPEIKQDSLFEHYIVRSEGGEVLLEIVPVCEGVCRVNQITVLSPRFLTEDGVRIGSTYADVVTHHTISDIIYRGGVYLVATKEGLVYAIAGEYYGAGDPPETLRPGEMPDDAVVGYIIIQND